MRYLTLLPIICLCSSAVGQTNIHKYDAAATLDQAVVKPVSFVANDFIWRCAQYSCRGKTYGYLRSDRRVCSEIARRFGKISSFVTNNQEMTKDNLSKCNERAKPTSPHNPR